MVRYYGWYSNKSRELREKQGNLDKMLLKVADNFDTDVEQRLKRMVTMVEPALILLMGAVIGMIVISMLTAILSVNDIRF